MRIKKITFGSLTWLDIISPTHEETKYLQEEFNFHPLSLEDCLSEIQRSKVDEYCCMKS